MTNLSQNTMPALIIGVMLASTVLQQKHSMSMKLSSSGSRMWRLATSPVLVARKEASVRQARGCLRNSAQQEVILCLASRLHKDVRQHEHAQDCFWKSTGAHDVL